MRFAQICVLLASLVPFQILAAPAPAPAAIPSTDIVAAHEATSDVAERAVPAVVVGIIAEIATNVIGEIADGVIEILSGEAAAKQRAFTMNTRDRLMRKYPNKNVLIYHDEPGNPSNAEHLQEKRHKHVEIPWNIFDTTKGYEVLVFEKGWFELAGDGGYENWAFGGNPDPKRSGKYVEFY